MVSVTELMEPVELPTDLRAADKGAVLFHLAGQVPVSVEDFSEDCRQNQSEVRDILQSRFQNEVQIDQTGFVSLTQAAWSPLLTEANPILNRAKDAESRGKRYYDDGDSEKAAKQYRSAAVLFSEVNKRLTTAGDVSDSLTQRLAQVSKTHDRIQKELAEDTVTHRKVLAGHRQDEGDNAMQSDDYAEAVGHFDDALLLYKGAKEAINTYNQIRLLSSSESIDSSEVDRLASAVKRKARNAKKHAEETPGSGETEPNTETTEPKTQTPAEIDNQVQTDVISNSDDDHGSSLSEADVIAEITQYVDEHDRIPTCEEIAKLSCETEEDILAHFDTWDSAIETADIDKQQRLIDRLQDVSEDVGVPPSVRQVDEHGVYTSETYIDEFGSWADAITAADLRNVSQDSSHEELSIGQALIQTLQRLDEETEVFPTMNDVRERTDFSPEEYKSEFGSWENALGAVGIDRRERLLEEIRRIARTVGSRPSVSDIDSLSVHSMGTFTKNFDNIEHALDTALSNHTIESGDARTDTPRETVDNKRTGEPSDSPEGVTSAAFGSLPRSDPTRQDYVEAIQLVAESRDTVVKATDVSDQTPYSVNDITHEFGSWEVALEAAEVDNKTRLLNELRRVADKLEHPPSTAEMNEHGHVSATFYSNYFASFTEAKEKALGSENETAEEGSSQTVAVTTTIGSIDEDSRLDQPIVVQVINSLHLDGDFKDVRLRVEDIDGNQAWLNIWSKHNINVSWETGQWHVLQNARGKYWTSNEGETGRSLSSTKDLLIKRIGTELPDIGTVVR